jgi:hypothetical protein
MIVENEKFSEGLRINVLDLMSAWMYVHEALLTGLVVLACMKVAPKLRQSISSV